MANDEITDAISTNAQGPAQARGDSGSITQHSLRDQIAADRYLAAKRALSDRSKPTLGVRFVKLVPPGAI